MEELYKRYVILFSQVRFREDEDEAELGPNTQSGGQRAVAIAVFLLALQRRSDAPFRIVDEINQVRAVGTDKVVHAVFSNLVYLLKK